MKNLLNFARYYQYTDYTTLPLCEVDSTILCQMSYYEFQGSGMERDAIGGTLREYYCETEKLYPDGCYTIHNDRQLVALCKEGGRHGNIRGGFYVASTDLSAQKQFSAITFELEPGLYYIAFRGTDNSVIGWKEDLNLSFQDSIPSQDDALSYTIRVMTNLPGTFYLGGHSKGGNLAIYTAAMLPGFLQDRCAGVFNHDGPGFLPAFYETEGYRRIREKIRKTVPESSFIGLLLEEDDMFDVVKSNQVSFFQHDMYSWEVDDTSFVRKEKGLDFIARSSASAFQKWLNTLEYEKREQMIDQIFNLVSDAGIEIVQDFTKDKGKRIGAVRDNYSELAPKERESLREGVRRLFSISAEEISAMAKKESKAFLSDLCEKMKERKKNQEKEITLWRQMDELTKKNTAVAFSGGVDSSLLLTVAAKAARRNQTKVIALMAETELHPREECRFAAEQARDLGVEFIAVPCDVWHEAGIEENPKDRCYRCKRYLLAKLKEVGESLGAVIFLEGSNADDLLEYRPGRRAVKELGFVSPLEYAGITKPMVRELADRYGIKAYNRPSTPCLATRFPYGTRLTPDKVNRVEQGEQYLKDLGCYNVRVRVHDGMSRIEVDTNDFSIISDHRKEIVERFKSLGFTRVALDLEGFASGSMDETV